MSLIEPDRCSCLAAPFRTAIRISGPVLSPLPAANSSGERLQHLDTDVRRIFDEQKHRATDRLATHRDILDNLPKALQEDDTVQVEELERILTLPDNSLRQGVTTRFPNTRAVAGTGAAPSRNSR